MKKYILFLLLLLIIIMPSISLADPFDGGSNTTCISLQNNLKYKASDATKNGEVSILQDFLQSQGYLNTDPTGYFNLATVSASKAFQTANGLTADGSVGPITRAKINAVSCGTVPVSTGTLPAGCILNYKFSPLTGIPCVPTPFSSSPAISGVSGPQQLNVNQSGTWTVTASDRSGGNLSYSVVWGDEGYMYGTSASNLQRPVSQQSATFTYSYANAGLYTPTFTVTNQNGQSAKTSLSVNVGNVTTPTPSITVLSPSSGVIGTQVTITGTGFTATGNKLSFGALGVENSPNYNNLSSNGTTITFTVPYSNYFACWDLTPACMIAATMISPGTYPVSITNANGTSNAVNFTVTSATAPSSVTVLSPNGGETWVKGTTQTIRWSDPYNCTLGQACPAVMSHHDIKLDTYYPPCTTNFCPMYPYHSPYTIVRDISNDSSYDWTVGKVLDSNNNVSDGSYMIQVCKTGTSICDSSDIYFKIV